jgi:hypothetical protein
VVRRSRGDCAPRQPGHQPVAGPGLLDRQVDHHVLALQLGQFRIVDPHAGVEDLAQHQDLARPLANRRSDTLPVVSVTRSARSRSPQDGYENPSAGEQFDDQAEDTGLLADDADADDDVAHPAHRLAVGPSTTSPRAGPRTPC